MTSDWAEHQKFERWWWGHCLHTYDEETKQLVYADRMKLELCPKRFPTFDLHDKRIADLGGGPVSLLLKCFNFSGIVVDPCLYPDWVMARYAAAAITYLPIQAEWWVGDVDEVWIYNVLQHVEDPETIIKNARLSAPTIRVFEWIDHPVEIGHPHTLTEPWLNIWLEGEGTVEKMDESGCTGTAYYGMFQ